MVHVSVERGVEMVAVLRGHKCVGSFAFGGIA
jgi:hypothetical protein